MRHGLIGLCLLLPAAAAGAADISGVAEVVDGDTIVVRGVVLELHGIDAVERDQLCMHRGTPWHCGMRAAEILDGFTGGRTVECTLVGGNPDGRRYARCRRLGLDLAAEMSFQGYALGVPRYSREYLRQRQEARQRAVGIWDSIYLAPDQWRLQKR